VCTATDFSTYDAVTYTDGSCDPNPGRGAWGFVGLDVRGWAQVEAAGGAAWSTNNAMELEAVRRALDWVLRCGFRERPRVLVRTDSQVAIAWASGLGDRGLHSSLGERRLREISWVRRRVQMVDVVWEWVRGHSGEPGNARADTLARGATGCGSGRGGVPAAWWSHV
jgi:ribonuclease HI